MTLEITSDFPVTCAQLVHLQVGGHRLRQHRITVGDYDDRVVHCTTLTCTPYQASRMALAFCEIWPDHQVVTVQLD